MSLLRRLSFQTKLLLSFTLIVILTTGLGYFLVSQTIGRAFTAFSENAFEHLDPVSLQLLAGYYERTGSWNGLRLLLRGGPQQQFSAVLVNSDNVVVLAPEPGWIGRTVRATDVAGGLPIVVNGRTVGTLLSPMLLRWRSPLETRFLSAVSLSLWIAGLAVAGIGILLAFGLFRQLTGPIKALDAASRRIAKGDLKQRVAVRSHDELGRLAASFNAMAQSLERSEQAKRQMIADVSHELRTPIGSVRTGLEALRDGLIEPTPENFAALHNRLLLTTRLVSDLQQLALADAGQLSIRSTQVSLREIVGRIQATIGVEIEDEGIALAVDLAPDLPPAAGDPQRIEQVLVNLLSNAIRYTPAGGTILVKAALDGDWIRVSVCDDGPGLPQDALGHVFDRFYRVDSSRERRTGGTGLGLAIAKALVEAHGGRIWAENAVGGRTTGACFHFTLSRADRPMTV